MPRQPANLLAVTQRQIQACAQTVLGRVMMGVKIPEHEREQAEQDIQAVTALLERLTSEAQAGAKK